MKHLLRDHLSAYGYVPGFLKRYRQLSDGMQEQEPSIEYLAFDLPCSSCEYLCTCDCQKYHLFNADWQEGIAQTGKLYAHMDLERVEDLGRKAGFTSKRPHAIIMESMLSVMERMPDFTARYSNDLSEAGERLEEIDDASKGCRSCLLDKRRAEILLTTQASRDERVCLGLFWRRSSSPHRARMLCPSGTLSVSVMLFL